MSEAVLEQYETVVEDLIQQGINAMFAPTDVVELRVPKANGGKGTISGYFVANHPKLRESIKELSGKHDGIYITLNPCSPALLARAANRYKAKAQTTTSDHDILKRTKLLVDIDPVRPAGVSATDGEIDFARGVTKQVYEFLQGLGWATPTSAESGNGFHLLYNIDLPNTKESADLIKAVLKALSDKFDNAKAKVDTSVFNAARIVKAYGSLAAKGDSTPERPHRTARVRKLGEGVVTEEQLKALAGTPPTVEKNPGTTEYSGSSVEITPEKIEEFFECHGILHHPAVGSKDNQTKWVLDNCIFNPDHKGKDAAVFLTDGMPGYHCLHNSCTDNHWKAFRKQAEASSGKKFYFGSGEATDIVVVGVYDEDKAKMAADIASLQRVPVFPAYILETSWVGALTKQLTKGTFIPPAFVYNDVKTALGSLVDGVVGFPKYPNLHTRHYSVNISVGIGAGNGKSEAMVRTVGDGSNVGALEPVLQVAGIELLNGGLFGSGEMGKKILSEYAHRAVLLRYDELVLMFQKMEKSTLSTLFLEMFDSKSSASGSLTNSKFEVTDVSVSFIGNITEQNFRSTLEGSGTVGSGFLSRCTIGFAEKTDWAGDWEDPDKAALGAIMKKIDERATFLRLPSESGKKPLEIPPEEPEANHLRQDFLKKFSDDREDIDFKSRLDAHFRRDLLLRALFSDEQTITAEMVQHSIDWTNHQLSLRKRLWFEDRHDAVESMALKITNALTRHKCASKTELIKLCNVMRDGSHETFNRAIRALHGTQSIHIGKTNRIGNDVFMLADGVK